MIDLIFKVLPAFLLTMGSSLIFNWLVIQFARKTKIVSKSDFRRKKKRRIALLGGVPLYISLWIAYLGFNIEPLFNTLVAAAPLILIGIVDDIKELRALQKSVIHMVSIGLWIYLTPAADTLLVKLGGPPISSYLIMSFWILGIINAVNMIDGMDSEASSFSIFAAGFFILLSTSSVPPLELIVFISACLGFLVFNKPPARLYLEDSGSTFLGFFLSTYSLTFEYSNLSYYTLLIPLFILALPEIDAIMAIYRRIKSKTSVSAPDHDHIHHKLLKVGFTVPQVIMILITVTTYCGTTAFLLNQLQNPTHILIVTMLSAFAQLSILSLIYLLEHKYAQQVANYSRSLIEQSFNLNENIIVDPDDFRIIVYDLLPYYKELQQRGIVAVQEFIQDFNEYVNDNFKTKQLKQYGSYSLIVLESPSQHRSLLQETISHNFFSLLAKHDIQKNSGKLPWGMSIYTNGKFGDQILKKFNVPVSRRDEKSYNKAG